MMNIQHFSKNTKGRDFGCGDIHGCFDLLEKGLKEVDFDIYADRLFTTGDMIDRHPDSIDFWDWLRQPWFHSVKGNHEQMAIDAFTDGPTSQAANMHYYNGGDWFYGIPTVEQQCYVEVMKDLPIGIEIETDNGLVGIVHAQVPFNDWGKFREYKNTDEWECAAVENVALWRRTIIDRQMEVWVEGVDKVFVGHSVVDKPTVLGNYHFIDTGSCFTGKLTLVQVN